MSIYASLCTRLLLCGTCIFSTHALAQNSSSNETSKWRLAAEAYEKNHWIDAFTTYAYLADSGHTEAARIAYQMWKYGTTLYATKFSATSAQLEQWRKNQLTSVLSPNSPPPQPPPITVL